MATSLFPSKTSTMATSSGRVFLTKDTSTLVAWPLWLLNAVLAAMLIYTLWDL